MIKKMFLGAAVCVLTLGVTVFAGEPAWKARVDVLGHGKEKNIAVEIVSKSENATLNHASWYKDESKNKAYASGQFIVKKDEWIEATFTVKPAEDGPLSLQLRGQYAAKNKERIQVWVYLQIVKVEGAEIVNADFSEKDDAGKPKAWYFGKKDDMEASFSDSEKAVKVWHDCPAIGRLKAVGGQEITITVKGKLAEVK